MMNDMKRPGKQQEEEAIPSVGPQRQRRQRPRRYRRRTTGSSPSFSSSSSSSSWTHLLLQFLITVWSFAVLIRLASSASAAAAAVADQQQQEEGDDSNNRKESLPRDFLTEDSVVLLTGAAGFIGSELALALHRTYRASKIICIDSMDGITPTTTSDKKKHNNNNNKEQDLALLEFKRQRVFNIMQTLGPVAHFYRTDFRPNVPQFAEAGEVPILHYIFTAHPDITHVVHLADASSSGASADSPQVIPHLAGETKAGMMESLLEELVKIKQEQGRAPHYVYASTHEIYHHSTTTSKDKNPNPPPFREELPLTTPSSFRGAAKLMDELLAQSYYERDGIYSIGLRFFSVYGPWGVPNSPSFELAEQIIQHLMMNTTTITQPLSQIQQDNKHVYDYIYIDDAVDAIMTAMQFRPPPAETEEVDDDDTPPVVINVGSGRGTTLQKISKILQSLVMDSVADDSLKEMTTTASDAEIADAETVSIASTDRAEALLGFQARVSLHAGLEQLLAWHYDRAFPYGGPLLPTATASDATEEGGSSSTAPTKTIADKGMVSCSPYDAECLRGAPVFPCASECARPRACTSSVYDDVLSFTRQLTAKCEAVLYTVALDEDLQSLPTANIVSGGSSSNNNKSFLSGTCNLAFVSDTSFLVRKGIQQDFNNSNNNNNNNLSHGQWTLVPLSLTSSTDSTAFLQLIPKLSPGLFFSANTQYAVYTDPGVMFASISALLQEVGKAPPPSDEERDGHTALLVGKSDTDGDNKQQRFGVNTNDYYKAPQAIVQEAAYRMIRIAVIDDLGDDGFSHPLDTSFLVHFLNQDSNDIRLFRCDVLEQIVQWDVTSDESALQFILGLHDLWNNVVTKRHQDQPWWTNGNIQDKKKGETTERQEIPAQENKEADKSKELGGNERNEKGEESAAATHRRRLEVMQEGNMGEEDSEDDEDGASGSFITGWGQEHNGFGMPESIQDAVRAVFGDASIMKQEEADDDNVEEDENNDEEVKDETSASGKGKSEENKETFLSWQPQQQDSSIWMGILSSSNVRHYAHIIPARQVGAILLDGEGRVLEQ